MVLSDDEAISMKNTLFTPDSAEEEEYECSPTPVMSHSRKHTIVEEDDDIPPLKVYKGDKSKDVKEGSNEDEHESPTPVMSRSRKHTVLEEEDDDMPPLKVYKADKSKDVKESSKEASKEGNKGGIKYRTRPASNSTSNSSEKAHYPEDIVSEELESNLHEPDYYGKYTHVQNSMIVCPSGPQLNSAMQQIATVIADCTLFISPTGITMTTMNPANTVLMHMTLPKACFSTYDVKKPFVLDINVVMLAQILAAQYSFKTFKSYLIELSTQEEDQANLSIACSALDTCQVKSNMSLLTFAEHRKIEIPAHNYECIIRMDCSYFLQCMMYLLQVTNATNGTTTGLDPDLIIRVDKSRNIEFQSSKAHHIVISPCTEPASRMEIRAAGWSDVSGVFSLNMVTAFARNNKKGYVTIFLHTGKPLVLQYVLLPSVGAGADDDDGDHERYLLTHGSIRYVIGPKITSEETL